MAAQFPIAAHRFSSLEAPGMAAAILSIWVPKPFVSAARAAPP